MSYELIAILMFSGMLVLLMTGQGMFGAVGFVASISALMLWGQGGEEMPFTRREIEVLRYLAAHSERPVPREELLHKVWGYARDLGIETRTVDIHIAKLRRKIEADPKQPQFILTVRGGGYRLQRGAA